MAFEIDEQTKKDLEIFPAPGNRNSLFDLFNRTKTAGGKDVLRRMLSKPLSDIRSIKNRQKTIAFFQKEKEIVESLDIDKNSLDFIEHYLLQGNYPTVKPSALDVLGKSLKNRLKPTNKQYIINRGVDYTIELLNNLCNFHQKIEDSVSSQYLLDMKMKMTNLLEQEVMKSVSRITELQKLKATKTANFDYTFRYTHRDKIKFCLNLIYEYDALIAIATVSEECRFCYPRLLPAEEQVIKIENLFHPFLKSPVYNSLRMDRKQKLSFVSGPNMAGKSTFLKSIGVAVFLAHLGLPVPADNMSMSLLSGVYTTINLSDNLNMGYSHFYAEVLRVKHIGEKLRTNPNILVIFDELFRGTNVKDAYDGTLAIVSAFARTRKAFYIISTHILEVAGELGNENIQYLYLETIMGEDDSVPVYTYKVKNGISEDRLGMYIIQKEKVVEIIDNQATTG